MREWITSLDSRGHIKRNLLLFIFRSAGTQFVIRCSIVPQLWFRLYFGIIQDSVIAGGHFSGPYQIETMSVSFDPNDELFRSFLVNDLKSVSSITTKSCMKECLVQENIKCSHCDVLLRDPLERAQHEKTHFTFECKYCYSLFVRQSDLTRHLETSHKMKSLLL